MNRCLLLLALAVSLVACDTLPEPTTPTEVFFDDFSQHEVADLVKDGWIVRTKVGLPGIEGAVWGEKSISLLDDPQQPGNRMLRLNARTDGSSAGTRQAQLCHQRKYLEGTYAARVRFNNAPVSGPDGDVVVQTFYTVSPLRTDFDPEYSELDWEYLPNGGWGDVRTRLYGVSWQTVRLDPWKTYNQPLEYFQTLEGWHVLMMQVGAGKTRFFLDGAQLGEHGGRNYPVVPMSLNFSIWFPRGGSLPANTVPRVYEEDVDWVYFARNQLLAPAEVERAVLMLRRVGKRAIDGVPLPQPPLASPCDF